MIIKEVSVETYHEAVEAVRKGADRIEISSYLPMGGVTPSLGMVSYTRERLSVPLSVMLRPRIGSFEYSEAEKQIILSDLRVFNQSGVDFIITGALIKDELDKEFLSRVREETHCELVCHMCFDETYNLEESMITLASLGFNKVLTKGGKGNAENNLESLANLITLSAKNIGIVVGGGVTYDNMQRIVDKTGAREIHGRKLFR